jgi:hypothetical protein
LQAFTFLLSFLVAQYLGFVVSRYTHRLDVCIETAEAASQVAFEAAVLLRSEKPHARQLVRYVHLILHLYYLTIDGPMCAAKWELLQQRKLCSESERATLETARSEEAAIAYVWAFDIVYAMHRRGVLSDEHAVRMETELSAVRRNASRQRDYHEAPIPMPFFHLMSVMAHVYLLVVEWNSAIRLARGLGDDDGWLVGEIIGTTIIMTSVNTLRRLALAMTNPFGDDETDYELDYDLRRLWAEARETIRRMPKDSHDGGRLAPPPNDELWGEEYGAGGSDDAQTPHRVNNVGAGDSEERDEELDEVMWGYKPGSPGDVASSTPQYTGRRHFPGRPSRGLGHGQGHGQAEAHVVSGGGADSDARPRAWSSHPESHPQVPPATIHRL